MDVSIEFAHDHTTTELWLDGDKLSVVAQHKYTDSHMSSMTVEQARKLRDWLNENLG